MAATALGRATDPAPGLLVSHRRVALPESGASYDSHELFHGHFRVRVVRAERLAIDEVLLFGDPSAASPRLGWTGPSLRPRLSVLLEGHAEIRIRGRSHVLAPGDVLLNRHLGDVTKRLGAGRATMLACDWELGSLGTGVGSDVTRGRMAAADLLALREAADELCAARGSPAAWLGTVLARLRSSGAPLDPPDVGAWDDAPPLRAQAIMNALDAALSALGDRPMTVDLESSMGLSRWQVQRELEEVSRHYALNGGTWRTLRQRWRLGVGFFLMTAPGATTERIARALGYGSPVAFCRAFSDANLPSPGEVRRRAVRG